MNIDLTNVTKVVPLCTALTAALLPMNAAAQDGLTTSNNPAAEASATVHARALTVTEDSGRVMVGGGLAERSTYEGSDRYDLRPVPVINVTYDDTISLGVGGLSLYRNRDAVRLGVGLTYQGARKESKDNSLFGRGDDRLAGMEKINATVGLRAFGSYTIYHVKMSGALTKFEGSDNQGLLVDAGASFPFPLSDRLILLPHMNLTWADRNYMQTFFGVTDRQAAASRFAQFAARAGLKDIRLGFNANYRFDEHWFWGIDADLKQLVSDAANSPLTFADSQHTLMTTVGYRF